MMSSTLVETVSINYEDFSDSFLTCGTCFCTYDNVERTPKLLGCSHTVCQSCLEHIIEAQGHSGSTIAASFRCPICRETISVPRGGVAAFPPSFIVNQLLDLMGRQRRDVIPKCSQHSQTELMFCESCDVVFCVNCTGESHNRGGEASAHTIIPFSIAIKRMSEILLYKASLCMKNLEGAADVVNEEMNKLDDSAERCIDAVVRAFEDVAVVVEQRKAEVIEMVRRVRDEKKRVLKEQLEIIDVERRKVRSDCQGLQQQVEVRNITAKIGDLNEKLDVSATLVEPRENAFMQFEFRHNTAMSEIFSALSRFGKITISKTFPALCSISVVPQTVTHLETTVVVTTVDYHGNARTTGGDPVVATLRTDKGNIIATDISDQNNGTYVLRFTPRNTGLHRLSIYIFDRPIKDSPFDLEVTDHIDPIVKIGTTGSGEACFRQPVNAIHKDGCVYVLDTGNSRIKVVDSELRVVRHITGRGLEQHSATGMALTPAGNLILVNWRTKMVTELSEEGSNVIQQFTSDKFIEPIAIAVNHHREIIIADNGAGKILKFDGEGNFLLAVGSKGSGNGQFKLISAVCTIPGGDNFIVGDSRLQVFSRLGQFLYDISSGSAVPGTYGGVCVDRYGWFLATRVEKGRSVVQVFSSDRKWLFDVDSAGDKLKRPSGLITNEAGFVFVVDLGNDCVKKYRYK